MADDATAVNMSELNMIDRDPNSLNQNIQVYYKYAGYYYLYLHQ